MYIIHIFVLYEWDDKKDQVNQEKHGVSFKAARAVFSDRMALVDADFRHSKDELRYKIVGRIVDGRVITIVFTYRNSRERL